MSTSHDDPFGDGSGGTDGNALMNMLMQENATPLTNANNI
jgi:hypothetical protein